MTFKYNKNNCLLHSTCKLQMSWCTRSHHRQPQNFHCKVANFKVLAYKEIPLLDQKANIQRNQICARMVHLYLELLRNMNLYDLTPPHYKGFLLGSLPVCIFWLALLLYCNLCTVGSILRSVIFYHHIHCYFNFFTLNFYENSSTFPDSCINKNELNWVSQTASTHPLS